MPANSAKQAQLGLRYKQQQSEADGTADAE